MPSNASNSTLFQKLPPKIQDTFNYLAGAVTDEDQRAVLRDLLIYTEINESILQELEGIEGTGETVRVMVDRRKRAVDDFMVIEAIARE